MNKLKVLQITDSLNVGGTEVLAVNIANSLKDFGVVSHVCSTREKGFLVDKLQEDVGYVFLNKKSTIDIKALFKLKKYIIKNEINIIHAHSTSLFFSFLLKLVVFKKISVFWHNHTGANYKLKGIKLKIIKFLVKSTKGIINVNNELNDWSKFSLKHKNTIMLNNFPLFIDLKEKTKLKGKDNTRIICLAALRPEKDHLNLLKAFKIVKSKFPDWTLHLIGKDYFDDYSNEIKNYINYEKLNDVVFFYGMCSDIKFILSQAEIGVLSSKNEGLPISLLEYGLANLPVLTTDVGECKRVINNKKAVVVPNNSDIFAKALKTILSNKELKKEISNSLNNNVKLYYSRKNNINEIIKFYKIHAKKNIRK